MCDPVLVIIIIIKLLKLATCLIVSEEAYYNSYKDTKNAKYNYCNVKSIFKMIHKILISLFIPFPKSVQPQFED